MKLTQSIIDRTAVLNSLAPVLASHNATNNADEIQSSSRRIDLVYSRALIAFILRQNGFTMAQIGYVLNRDHATAVHLLKYGKIQGHALKNIMGAQKELIIKYKKAIEGLKYFSLDSISNDWVIKYHEERIAYHQAIINSMKQKVVA